MSDSATTDPGTLSIEVINPQIEKGRVQHALFDHDGTISTLREGWEVVMEAMMIDAITGFGKADASEADRARVREASLAYIDESTGIQTILQMEHLVQMVRDFGFVANKDVQDAVRYKKIYNDLLLSHIAERREAVTNGAIHRDAFCVTGAPEFLAELRVQGIALYLASGTDEADVKHEAELLGYSDLFNGGIFGAVGDISKYSKRMVIDRILKENDLSGLELVCFGDGPVEIRETKARGGIGVGVASDEVNRRGVNPAKRERLIKAGADFIIPDFSDRTAVFQQILK